MGKQGHGPLGTLGMCSGCGCEDGSRRGTASPGSPVVRAWVSGVGWLPEGLAGHSRVNQLCGLGHVRGVLTPIRPVGL